MFNSSKSLINSMTVRLTDENELLYQRLGSGAIMRFNAANKSESVFVDNVSSEDPVQNTKVL